MRVISIDSELGVSKDLRAEIEQFLSEYGEAFSSLNAEAVVSFFAMPFYVELDGDSLVWSPSEKGGLVQATDGLLDYYRGVGVKKVDPRVEIILRTGKSRVTVVMSWLLCDDQGTRWALDKSYHLIRDGGSWKIWACCGTETQGH